MKNNKAIGAGLFEALCEEIRRTELQCGATECIHHQIRNGAFNYDCSMEKVFINKGGACHSFEVKTMDESKKD